MEKLNTNVPRKQGFAAAPRHRAAARTALPHTAMLRRAPARPEEAAAESNARCEVKNHSCPFPCFYTAFCTPLRTPEVAPMDGRAAARRDARAGAAALRMRHFCPAQRGRPLPAGLRREPPPSLSRGKEQRAELRPAPLSRDSGASPGAQKALSPRGGRRAPQWGRSLRFASRERSGGTRPEGGSGP